MTRAPSEAFTRFKSSMNIDYYKWKDGEPYDIAALADITPAERDDLTDEIAARPELDWRDVEALKALATPKALARISHAAQTQDRSGGAEALIVEIESGGWDKAKEKRLIEMLENMRSMESSSDRLFGLCEEHLSPAIRAQLMRNARIQSDPTMRYSSAAFVLYLAGHVDSHYVFDEEHRPHLLDLNSDDYKTYKAAVAWLEDKVAHPKT